MMPTRKIMIHCLNKYRKNLYSLLSSAAPCTNSHSSWFNVLKLLSQINCTGLQQLPKDSSRTTKEVNKKKNYCFAKTVQISKKKNIHSLLIGTYVYFTFLVTVWCCHKSKHCKKMSVTHITLLLEPLNTIKYY